MLEHGSRLDARSADPFSAKPALARERHIACLVGVVSESLTNAQPTTITAAFSRRGLGVWGYAAGYFACYAPYSGLTKAVTEGRLGERVSGVELLPLTALASCAAMLVFLAASGWWRHAGKWRGIPSPGRWTLLSGICTAGIMATTTLAYTLRGVSIVLMMLLMRGGVLVIAPLVDAMSKRSIRWPSWLALGLSLAALVVALGRPSSPTLTALAIADVSVYLLGYFVRLRFMSRIAKSQDRTANLRYFVEEQLVASPALVVFLGALALGGQLALRSGFSDLLGSELLGPAVVIGVLSQGTGVFGTLILLDGRENTFCVPVNRASSVLAGIVATAALGAALPAAELAGGALIVIAVVILAFGPRLAGLGERAKGTTSRS